MSGMVQVEPFLPELLDIGPLRLAGELRFNPSVYWATLHVPVGKVVSYGDVAAIIGAPRAARQVGYALAALSPDPADFFGQRVPWWRVIRGDGSIALQGDPGRGPLQATLLRADGVVVSDMRVDMGTFRWRR
jgi:methylated-DNA-protein-cysteine methyltransferase-like protein